jgi:hypothetical protein
LKTICELWGGKAMFRTRKFYRISGNSYAARENICDRLQRKNIQGSTLSISLKPYAKFYFRANDRLITLNTKIIPLIQKDIYGHILLNQNDYNPIMKSIEIQFEQHFRQITQFNANEHFDVKDVWQRYVFFFSESCCKCNEGSSIFEFCKEPNSREFTYF